MVELSKIYLRKSTLFFIKEKNILVKDIDGFPERLRTLIGEASVSSFARRCGLSESLMRAYLSGGKKPGMRYLAEISQACNVSMDWLTTGSKSNRTQPLDMCDSAQIKNPSTNQENNYKSNGSENRTYYNGSDSKGAIPENETHLISERIREVIGDQFVSAFARRSGVSEAVIRTYTHDKRMPSLSKAAAIAQAGGVTLDWLATGREPKFRRDLVAAASPETAPAAASGEAVDFLTIYKDAPPEARNALIALAVAIRDRTLRAWLAAGQAIAETAQLFDRTK